MAAPKTVTLTATQREEVQTAASRIGIRPFLAAANVRSAATFWRALGGGPLVPCVAAALVATADQVRNGALNTQPPEAA